MPTFFCYLNEDRNVSLSVIPKKAIAMNTRLFQSIFVILNLMFFAVYPAMVQEKPASAFASFTALEYQKSIQKIQTELAQLLETKKLLVQEYDSNVIQISGLKQKKELGFFERMQLKKLLKDSEDLSRQIIQVDREITGKHESSRTYIDKMIPLMEYEIRQALNAIESAVMNSGGKNALIQKLQGMIQEKLEYQSYIAEPLRARVRDVKYQRTDDPEVLFEKSDFLMDQHDKLKRYANQIDLKIDLLESEYEIKKQARKFIDDVYTFDKDREMKMSSKRVAGISGEGNEPGSAVFNSRASEDDLAVSFESGLRGTTAQGNPLFLNTTLEISALQITSHDDFRNIIRKLKHEKSLALQRAKNMQKSADEIRRLAEIKLRYSR